MLKGLTKMHSRLALLLCCAGLAGVAVATRDLSADGRSLLQTETDCKRSIDNCATCRYAFFHGTVTKAICLSCDAGYVVAEEGRMCCEWPAGGVGGWLRTRGQGAQPQRVRRRQSPWPAVGAVLSNYSP
jgi:hypothetical protein